ncbi:glyoxalase domain protein [Burkholderia pseudomallei]|nr:glyoxalase domain protein [Burkholderia pseudomallei]
MFSHVCMGVTDVERAFAFYAPLMEALRLDLKFRDPHGWTGWKPAGAPRPLFLIGRPFDGAPHAPGNGQMTAFLPRTARRSTACTRSRCGPAARARARPACGRTTTRIITARTFATSTATSCAYAATSRHSRARRRTAAGTHASVREIVRRSSHSPVRRDRARMRAANRGDAARWAYRAVRSRPEWRTFHFFRRVEPMRAM